MAPTCISELINVRRHARFLLHSNSGTILIHPAGKMKKSFGDRSFSVAAPTLWNALPASLRHIDSVLNFNLVLSNIFLSYLLAFSA